ncbi:MAG: hypothetical protein ACFB3T_10775 [Geminicoccaceae bacterium]
MKYLFYLLLVVLGGGIGFFLGGSGGMLAGSVAGTEFGVCTAVQVAENEGLLDAAQSATLLEQTAAHLRSEFAELVERANLSENMPLNSDTCTTLMARMKQGGGA